MQPQFPAKAHIALLMPRYTLATSRWRSRGNVFTNSPAEWTDTIAKATAFRANPTAAGQKSGNATDRAFHVWRGYPAATGIDPAVTPNQYPTYEGEGQIAAAMVYALTGNVSFGNAVKTALLAQVRQRAAGMTTGFIGAYADELPALPITNRPDRRPNSWSWSNEAVWINKLGQAFCLCRSLFTPQEEAEFTVWHDAWANFFAGVLSSRLIASVPGYLSLDLSVRTGNFSDAWPVGNEPLYYRADGTPGPGPVAVGERFGNVHWTFVGALASNYLLSGRGAMLQAIRAYYNAYLFFAVYPDGTTTELIRNNDYGNPARGVWYERLMHEEACKTELMLRMRGQTMLDITQMGGLPINRVPVGGQPKTLKLVLDRFLTYYTGSDMRYGALPVANNTRLYSPYVGPPASDYGDDFETGPPSVFGMAFQIYGDANYRLASRHGLPGMRPLPSNGYSSSRTLQSWFNGAGNDIYPGAYGVWSNLDARAAYAL